jgi:hypothetical protein
VAISPRIFGNIELPCPGQPERYLAATYGWDWASTGATHLIDHTTNNWIQAKNIMTKKNLEKFRIQRMSLHA